MPDWLKACPNEDTLVDAMSVVLRDHERLGIDVICDGELGRWDLERNAPGGMVERFARKMSGIQIGITREQRERFEESATTSYRANSPGVAISEIGEGELDLEFEWRRVKALSEKALKFTITSPYMLGRVVANGYYQKEEDLVLAMADVLASQVKHIDAAVVQIDEPNLPGKPEDAELAAEAINRVLDQCHKAAEKAVHLCFGNYGGQMIQKGHYRELISFLNALHCDHLVLETTRRPSDELSQLKDVRPEIRIGMGVIDVKDLQIESGDRVARRIETLVAKVGGERLAYVHPDCGLQHLSRRIAIGKLAALVEGRNLFLGEN